MKTMIARRLFATLALLALMNNVWVFARPIGTMSPAPEGQAFTLVSIKHETVGAMTRILIESTAPPLYAVFRPTEETLVVDMPGGEGSKLAQEYAVKNAMVDSIVVRNGRNNAPTTRPATRIEIGVRSNVKDRSTVNGNTLVIELTGAQARVQDANNIKAAAQKETPGVYVHPVPVAARTNSPVRERVEAKPAALKPASIVRSVRGIARFDKGRIVEIIRRYK